MRAAVRGERTADVPCEGCTACCTASQFIHIGPDETDTLAHVPRAIQFAAPGRPPGHMVLGYDNRGHCPMLVDNRCSIYEHRPRTCRTYDCRVFAATGVEIERGQERIAQRARRWRFAFPDDADRIEYEAVRAAAAFVGAPLEAPTHFSQFDPLATLLWGQEWFERGCISSHFRTMVVEGELVRATLTTGRSGTGRIAAEKADGTPVLNGTASVGPDY